MNMNEAPTVVVKVCPVCKYTYHEKSNINRGCPVCGAKQKDRNMGKRIND